MIHYASIGDSFADSMYLKPICQIGIKTKKDSTRAMHLKWKNSCLENQKWLENILHNAKVQVESVMPQNIRNRPKDLNYFVKRSICTAQDVYEQILLEADEKNQRVCDEIFTLPSQIIHNWHNCSEERPSMNFQYTSKTGCAGAVIMNGTASQEYCEGDRDGKYDWWSSCCVFRNGRCTEKYQQTKSFTPI